MPWPSNGIADDGAAWDDAAAWSDAVSESDPAIGFDASKPAPAPLTVTLAVGSGAPSAKTWPTKDPDDILDYGYNITGFDETDAIASTVATVKSGSGISMRIVQHKPVTGQVATKTRLAGGTAAAKTTILIRTTMTSGQRVDQTIDIDCQER